MDSCKTIGILGGGQLASLIGTELLKKNLKFCIYAQDINEPACEIAHYVVLGEKNDLQKLEVFFESVDFVLLESEFYSPELLVRLEEKYKTKVYPELSSYKVLFSKANQKEFFCSIKIPNVNNYIIKSIRDIDSITSIGPFMVKLSHGGYDGYGNTVVQTKKELLEFLPKITNEFKNAVVVEEFITIKKEFASMLVVGRSNSIIFPPCHTVQENSICTLVEYPSFLSDSTHNKLESIMQKLSLHIKGRGIYAFEFFEDDKGDVYINEAAPRVHNSYHFTIEAFEKNQFEYFIDAVLGNDLYPVTEVHPFVSMVNLLGHTEGEDYQLKYPNIEGEFKTKIHMYGKKECRKGRKMGHLTLYGKTHNFDYAKKINREYTL